MRTLIELLRPWKLATFAIGLGLLIAGAEFYHYSDWDIGVSVVMAVLTYLTAPWSMRVLWERRWKRLPLAAFYGWLSVDGCYWAWHTFAGNDMLRAEQWPTSLCLWLICGLLWLPQMDLISIGRLIRHGVQKTRTEP
jgi:hypothetical protein